ncbi:RNA polymerase sigma-70 factor [Flavihumibacter sp. R14]|nr:RNA polymerase sigma-70 factor [Flavihumibacter soli]
MSKYNILSDLELASLLKEGDRAAFTEIYDRYIFVLLNHAYNKTRDRELAKDMVQEVFTMLWSMRESLQLNTNVSGFLYTSIRNTILNQIAHKGVQGKYLESLLKFSEQGQTITDHLIREKQFGELIEKEIAALTPKMRTVFELSRKEHLSHKEIAEKLQISEQTVSKHVTNALHILRVKLGIFVYLLWIIHPK